MLRHKKYDSTCSDFEDNVYSLIPDSYWAYPNITCNPIYKVNDQVAFDELCLKGEDYIPHCPLSTNAKAAQFAQHGI